MTELRFEDIIEIYGAQNAVEADRIVLLLEEEGIEAMARESSLSSSFPSPVEAHYLICIRASARDKAKEIIDGARRDGAISDGGSFL